MLQTFIETILPPIIAVCELIGIFVVAYSALHAFWEYLRTIFGKKNCNFKFELADGLASGLEFKMAAEILKTVLVRTISELVVLGAIILLRALLSVLIHFEIKSEKSKEPPSGEA